MIYDDATLLIGKTPVLRLSRFLRALGANGELLAKLESKNPAGSIKDRVALSMIDEAEKSGKLKKGGVVIEPTSGNTGIGLALVCAVRGYKLILTMPSSMSEERKKTLRALGAELVLTAPEKGMTGAVEEANRLLETTKNSIIAGQFDNPANPKAHYFSTAEEILDDCGKDFDAFVAGVGTGGTLTGTALRLKEENADIKVVAVEPFDSPLLSEGKAGVHKIQGIGANFVPSILRRDLIDEIATVKTEEAYNCARLLARTEGVTCGISGGAALFAGVEFIKKNEGAKVVVILPDGGDRYLSTELFE